MAASTSTDTNVEVLRRMMLIRAFDSLLPDLYTRGLIRGSSHAAIGQEAVAVGACAALAADDYITSTHRGHGHAIAKGCDVNRMMAELLGRRDGYCRGKGGSMHIADFSLGMLGANVIVGGRRCRSRTGSVGRRRDPGHRRLLPPGRTLLGRFPALPPARGGRAVVEARSGGGTPRPPGRGRDPEPGCRHRTGPGGRAPRRF